MSPPHLVLPALRANQLVELRHPRSPGPLLLLSDAALARWQQGGAGVAMAQPRTSAEDRTELVVPYDGTWHVVAPRAEASLSLTSFVRGVLQVRLFRRSQLEHGMDEREARDWRRRILDLTNRERARAGVGGLREDGQLTEAAQSHCMNMALEDCYGHVGFDGSTPPMRVAAAGYRAEASAENLCGGLTTAEDAVQGWMDSPGHRANLLAPHFVHLGVGVYRLAGDGGAARYGTYQAQVFGQPAG